MKTDVLIIGKGISGVLLSYLLNQKGIGSIILDKGNKNLTPLAETIPPSTLSLLNNLELLTLFEECASKTYGYQSKWNNAKVLDRSFFNYNPYKYGLKLNKTQLLQRLEQTISNNIVPYDLIENIKLQKKSVFTNTKNNSNSFSIESKIIVDATGRNRALLKKLDIQSVNYDDTLAFICYVPKNDLTLKYGFFTESFNEGWGTVSNLNETTRIITLYTSKSNATSTLFKSYKNWNHILHHTHTLKKCLPNNGVFKVIGKQANSSKPTNIVGKNWLAIGDAAMAFDPISSHGISNTLFCCNKASNAIKKYISNKNAATLKEHYEDVLTTIFHEYLKQKEKLYDTKTAVSI